MAEMTDGGVEAAGSKHLISRDLCRGDRHLSRSWDEAFLPVSKVNSVPAPCSLTLQSKSADWKCQFAPRSSKEGIPSLFLPVHRKSVWKSVRTPLTLAQSWLLRAWCPAASGDSWSDSHVPAAV